MKHTNKYSRLAGLLTAGIILPCTLSAQSTFSSSYLTVFDSQASDYIVSVDNVQRYSEWQSPPVTYWGPSANDVLGMITYEFPFVAPSAQISLTASLASFNFVWGNANGYFGSGTGSSSLWASTDGSSWQLLLDDPTPQNWVDSYLNYNQNLPGSLLGTSSLWLQVRMEVDGAPNSSYTDAQFSRSSTSQPNNVFSISVTTVPEPSATTLIVAGFVFVLYLQRGRLIYW